MIRRVCRLYSKATGLAYHHGKLVVRQNSRTEMKPFVPSNKPCRENLLFPQMRMIVWFPRNGDSSSGLMGDVEALPALQWMQPGTANITANFRSRPNAHSCRSYLPLRFVQVASQSFGGVTSVGRSDPSVDRRRPRSSAYKFAPGRSRSTTSPPPHAYDWQGARNRSSCRCLLPWYVVFWTLEPGGRLQFLFISFPVLSLISLISSLSSVHTELFVA